MSNDVSAVTKSHNKKAGKKTARALAILKKDTGICPTEAVTRQGGYFAENGGIIISPYI